MSFTTHLIALSEIDVSQQCMLNTDEQRRAAQFKFDKHRHQFLASHIALRLTLASHLNIAPESILYHQEPNGKPYLNNHPCHFNLSHAGEYALIGIADQPIGVDIEKISSRGGMDIAKRFFHPDESTWLQAQPTGEQQSAFFWLWTRKEAFVKCTGKGIAEQLDQFSVLTDHFVFDNKNYHLADGPNLAGYHTALAMSDI